MRDMKKSKKVLKRKPFDKFVAILDKNFKTYDKRYISIVVCGASPHQMNDKRCGSGTALYGLKIRIQGCSVLTAPNSN